MSDDVISLAEKTGDAFMVSQEDALKDALNECESGGCFEGRKKILILSVDDDGGQFEVNFIQAGMTMSQCISLCEVSKAIFLKEMNYV